jgi:DedD protein
MAKSVSDEELQLRKRARRRLVGAIALVTIIAVFLPMVLDHEPRPVSQDVSIQIPSPNAGVFTSKIVPVVPMAPGAKPAPEAAAKPDTPPAGAEAPAQATPPAKSEAPKVAAASAPKPAAQAPAPAENDAEAAPPKKPQSQPKHADKPKAAEKPKDVEKIKLVAKGVAGYVVQVAALNDADKAKQMREQIAAAGFKAYTEVVPTAKGNVTRVRAGPFATREDADKARDKLKGMGLNGNVIPK